MDKDKLYRGLLVDAHAGRLEQVATALRTLLTLRNEVPRLLSFFVDEFLSLAVWDRSVKGNEMLADAINVMMLLPRRQLIKNIEFQKAFVQVASAVLMHYQPLQERERWLHVVNGVDGRKLERKLESTMMCLEAFKECKLVNLTFRKLMSTETARLFDALYHYLRHREKKPAQLLVKYIIGIKSISFDRVPANVLFDDVKDECRADIVWYVWWFLITYCKMRMKESAHSHYMYNLVNAVFRVFKLFYTKRNRERRVGILHALIHLMMQDAMLDIEMSSSASNELDIFVETAKPRSTEPVVAAPENEKGIYKKCKYLDCVIYDGADDD